MARESFINIRFPFLDSEKGFFLDMTQPILLQYSLILEKKYKKQ